MFNLNFGQAKKNFLMFITLQIKDTEDTIISYKKRINFLYQIANKYEQEFSNESYIQIHKERIKEEKYKIYSKVKSEEKMLNRYNQKLKKLKEKRESLEQILTENSYCLENSEEYSMHDNEFRKRI